MNLLASLALLLSVATFTSAQDDCADEIAAIETCLGVGDGYNQCKTCIKDEFDKIGMTGDAGNVDVARNRAAAMSDEEDPNGGKKEGGGTRGGGASGQEGDKKDKELGLLNVIVGNCVKGGACDSVCRPELVVTLKCSMESVEQEEEAEEEEAEEEDEDEDEEDEDKDSTPPISIA